MTLFTKRNCILCNQLKKRFDLSAMNIKEEVLDGYNPKAAAHLAWHSLADIGRSMLPILILDDSTYIFNFSSIMHQLASRAGQYEITHRKSENSTRYDSSGYYIN